MSLKDLSLSEYYEKDIFNRNFYLNFNKGNIDVEKLRKNLNIL